MKQSATREVEDLKEQLRRVSGQNTAIVTKQTRLVAELQILKNWLIESGVSPEKLLHDAGLTSQAT